MEDQLKNLYCIYYIINRVILFWSLCHSEIELSKENKGSNVTNSRRNDNKMAYGTKITTREIWDGFYNFPLSPKSLAREGSKRETLSLKKKAENALFR